METHIRLGVSGREIGGSGVGPGSVVHELSFLQGLVVESWGAFFFWGGASWS